MVLDCIKGTGGQAMECKPVSTTPPWSWLKFLIPGSCFKFLLWLSQWWAVIRNCKPNKLPKLSLAIIKPNLDTLHLAFSHELWGLDSDIHVCKAQASTYQLSYLPMPSTCAYHFRCICYKFKDINNWTRHRRPSDLECLHKLIAVICNH